MSGVCEKSHRPATPKKSDDRLGILYKKTGLVAQNAAHSDRRSGDVVAFVMVGSHVGESPENSLACAAS